jgi:menaquinone-dependent protoporphyrinogen IX oxidase
MKGLIIYKSKYGSTKKYAKWISEKFNFDCISPKHFHKIDIKKYDTIILGSLVYRGKLKIRDFLVNNWAKVKDKEVLLYAVGAAKPSSKAFEKFYFSNIPKHIRNKITFFPLRGKFNFKQLTIFDKIQTLIRLIRMKPSKTKREIKNGFNDVCKENLFPLFYYIKCLKEGKC